MHVGGQQSRAVQLPEDGRDATGAVYVFHQVGAIGCDLAQTRDAPRDVVDLGDGEVEFGLVRGGQQVQQGVRRAAHRYIHRHRVTERRV